MLAPLFVCLTLTVPALAQPSLSPQARRDLSALVTAYPGAVTAIEVDPAGRAIVVLGDGTRLPYDDGRVRSDEDALNTPDLRTMPAQTGDFHAWGFPLLPVSAAHGHGQNELAEALAELLPEKTEEPEAEPVEKGLRLAVLGRPNAGKSSLVNALVGEQRLIVSEVAGTTRDSVDVTVLRNGRRYVFVDTAGVRKRTHITDGLERYSVGKALGSAKRADVGVVVIDATGGIGIQDKRLIAYLAKEGTAFLIAVNKVDMIPQKDMLALRKALEEELRICPHVPVLYVSALKGKSVGKVLPTAEAIWKECQIRVGTGME